MGIKITNLFVIITIKYIMTHEKLLLISYKIFNVCNKSSINIIF